MARECPPSAALTRLRSIVRFFRHWSVAVDSDRATRFGESDAQTEEEHNEWLLFKTKGTVGEGDEDTGEKVDVEKGPPPGSPGPVSEQTNLPDENSLRILAAAELALLRCREQAGVRLRRRQASCPECLERVKNVPHNQVVAALGPEGVEALGNPNPIDLVAGGGDLLRHLLVNWGYPDRAAARLCGALELYAGRTLYSDLPPPVPATLVAMMQAA